MNVDRQQENQQTSGAAIDFINKTLIMKTTDTRTTRDSEMSANKDLGIYEGCYVELRDGSVVGPVKLSSEDLGWPWHINEGAPCWSDEGFIWHKSKPYTQDIIRVIDPANLVNVPISDRPEAPQGIVSTIPPHVTKAAMDAGIKAEPAYEQFVNAVLEAGFRAQYGIEFVGHGETISREQYEDKVDGLKADLESAVERIFKYGEHDWVRMNYPAQYDRLNAATPKNESENRIQDSEKAKGGLSDLPLDGFTIVFTGALSIPRETHKGIAESLGARVAGSVHKHTTLVVYGPGAGSKLDKANELCLPRMSEEAWLWLAARFGYGKPQHVSPYGKMPTTAFPLKGYDLSQIGSALRHFLVGLGESRGATLKGVWLVKRNEMEATFVDDTGALIPVHMRVPEGFEFPWQTQEPEKVATPTIPSVQTIEEAIRSAVREWRETNPDMGMVPPISMIAKKVHAVIAGNKSVDPESIPEDKSKDQIQRFAANPDHWNFF